jgi:hypothetical protein
MFNRHICTGEHNNKYMTPYNVELTACLEYIYMYCQGVPEFDSIGNLVTVLTNIIYICSVEHSATNFPQYEQYGFPPNLPATLHGQPEHQNVSLCLFQLVSTYM